MKTLILLATLVSSQSHAAPSLGDQVRYQMTEANGTSIHLMEQKIEVTAINAAKGTFETKVTITYNGTLVSEETQDSDLNSATESETTLDHCSEMPADMATIETITVPAGMFKVCHIKTEQSGVRMDQYMGRVLFGLVKSVTADSSNNTTTTFELIEIKKH